MSNEQFTPPPPPGNPSGPRVTRDDLRDPSRLRRVVQGRQVAGVASGVARYFDVDPTVVRVIWAVSAFFGVGIVAYIALWILVPEDGSPDQPFGLDERNRGILVAGIAVLAVLGLFGSSWGWIDFPWPLLVIGGIVAVVLSRRGRPGAPGPYGPAQQQGPQPSDQGSTAPTPGQVWNGSAWVPAGTPGTPLGYESAAGGGTWTDSSGWTGSTGSTSTHGSWQYTHGPHGTGQYWVSGGDSRPRRRGPLLFWWTMLAVLVATGSMAAFGVSSASAYPAVALAVVAAALVLGAFWGRAGGLILIGLLLLPVLAVSTGAERISETTTTWRPTTAAAVQDSYQNDFGTAVLDLSKVTDPENLAGRTLTVRADVGKLEILLPSTTRWKVDGTVDLGHMDLPDSEQGGFNINASTSHDPGDVDSLLTIDAQLDVGDLVVRRVSVGTDEASTPSPTVLSPSPTPLQGADR